MVTDKRTLPPAPAIGLSLLIFLSPVVLTARADWPDFRGPRGDGSASAPGGSPVGFPIEWSETNNIVWKTAIPFKGWSTPVILSGQIWLTSAKIGRAHV